MAKVLKTLKKKAQATPVVGVILDSLKSENPTQNAPSIQAVLNNLRPRQLLINGDFQINQRGQSEYTGQGVYSLDMWQIHAVNGNTISQLESGYGVLINKVQANQTVLRQYEQYATREDIGKQFTCCYDFESDVTFINEIGFGKQRVSLQVEQGRKRYSHTFTLNESDFEDNDVLCFLVFNNTQDNVQLKVYNADLFEGDIVYPHVKKSYQDDLWECMKYVQKLGSRVIPLNKTWGNQRNSVLVAYIAVCRTMVSAPTIEVNWSSWIYSSNDSDGYDVSIENCNFIIRVLNNEIDIRITKKDGGIFSKNYDYFINTTGDGILLTCEPL